MNSKLFQFSDLGVNKIIWILYYHEIDELSSIHYEVEVYEPTWSMQDDVLPPMTWDRLSIYDILKPQSRGPLTNFWWSEDFSSSLQPESKTAESL